MTPKPTVYSSAHFLARQAMDAAIAELHVNAPQAYELSPPREGGRGVLACPVAFSLAKQMRSDPTAIAGQLATAATAFLSRAPAPSLLLQAVAVGGYVNFLPSPEFHGQAIAQAQAAGEAFGSQAGEKRKIIVEFSQPNVGKPFHIGHIRSTILGDSIIRLLRSQGAEPIAFNYLGDAGTQVAKLVVALEEFHDLPMAVDEKGLLAYYTRIHKEIEANPQLNERAREITQKIEAGDPATLEVVEKIRALSLQAFNRNYELLDVRFDEVTGESAFIAQARERVKECVEKHAAFVEKDGSIISDLEKQGLPNTILLRSNGTTLYLTRDLALADYKFGKYAFDDSLVITASEQNMHFRQLQKILSLIGRPYAPNYRHLGFGLVFLQSGRLSTREGNVIFLEDVLNEAIDSARAEIESRKLGYPEEEINEISRIVGIGSTKFAFLRITSERNITFDPKKATSFEGDTGAYVQYTCVRAKNILRKLKESQNVSASPEKKSPQAYEWNLHETQLAESIALFPPTLENAARGYSPHVVCDSLLRLAAQFSAFYESHSVLGAESEGAKIVRTQLVEATAITLENGLRLLGIRVPARM